MAQNEHDVTVAGIVNKHGGVSVTDTKLLVA